MPDPLHDPLPAYSIREWDRDDPHRKTTQDALVIWEGERQVQMIFHDPDELLTAGEILIDAARDLEIAQEEGLSAICPPDQAISIPPHEQNAPRSERMYGITDKAIQEFLNDD